MTKRREDIDLTVKNFVEQAQGILEWTTDDMMYELEEIIAAGIPLPDDLVKAMGRIGREAGILYHLADELARNAATEGEQEEGPSEEGPTAAGGADPNKENPDSRENGTTAAGEFPEELEEPALAATE